MMQIDVNKIEAVLVAGTWYDVIFVQAGEFSYQNSEALGWHGTLEQKGISFKSSMDEWYFCPLESIQAIRYESPIVKESVAS